MKNRVIKAIVFCSIILFSLNSIAQIPGEEDQSGGLENTSNDLPISDYIIPMLLLGVIIGFRYHRKPNLLK
jgi:hypothetical protein